MPPSLDARNRLLDAALAVLRQKGYAATRVDDVCAAAGLSKGAFFHHFVSKEALAVAAVEHWIAVTGELFQQARYHLSDDPLQRVLGYVDFRRGLIQGETWAFSCLAGTLVQEMWAESPAIRTACERAIVGHAGTLVADLEAAQRLYAPNATWRADSLAVHTQAVLQGAFVVAKACGSLSAAHDSVDHLRRYLELLLGAGAPHITPDVPVPAEPTAPTIRGQGAPKETT